MSALYSPLSPLGYGLIATLYILEYLNGRDVYVVNTVDVRNVENVDNTVDVNVIDY